MNDASGPPDARDRFFTVTFFPDIYARTLTTRELSLDDLCQMVLDTTASEKKKLPWLKLAKFGTVTTAKDCLRNDANVISINGAEGDYDLEEMAFEKAVELMRSASIRALMYTSPSHGEGKPRWRVVAPTSRDLPPAARYQLVARINGVFGGVFKSESFAISQSFYYGSVNRNPDHRAVVIDGDFIDTRDDLDANALGSPTDNAAQGGDTNVDDGLDLGIDPIAPDDPRLAGLSAKWKALGCEGTDIETDYGGDRSRAAMAFACECWRAGIDKTVIAACLMHWKIGEHIREQADVLRALKRTIERSRQFVKDSKLFAMNEKHCVLPIGGKTRVATWGVDPDFPGILTIVRSSTISDFKALYDKYSHTFVGRDKNGNPVTITMGLGSWWISQPNRRQYDGGMRFMPERDEDVVGDILNMWQGFAVPPRKPEGKSGASGCNLFLDHCRKIICSDNDEHYDYFIKREAFIAQKRTRSEIAVGLRTEMEGTGKGFTARGFNHLYGVHAMEVQHPEHVTGKHNRHLEVLLRLTADEALFALDPRHRNTLYNLITESRITIEPKFVDVYTAMNHLNIDVISNAKHFLPVSGSARRLFVPTVSSDRANDHKYFQKISVQLNNDGGYEALLYHLLNEIDIRDFNVRDVPKTAALAEQAGYSRKGIDLLVEIACNEAMVPCQDSQFPGLSPTMGYDERKGFDYFIDHHSDRELSRLGALTVKRRLSKEWGCLTGRAARMTRANVTAYGVLWPPLAELRERFAAKYGHQEWIVESEEWTHPL